MPTNTPTSAKAAEPYRSMGNPAKRAARLLPPTAKTLRPQVEWRLTSSITTNRPKRIMTGTLMPSTFPVPINRVLSGMPVIQVPPVTSRMTPRKA